MRIERHRNPYMQETAIHVVFKDNDLLELDRSFLDEVRIHLQSIEHLIRSYRSQKLEAQDEFAAQVLHLEGLWNWKEVPVEVIEL